MSIEKTYKKVSQIEHILMRPDMYIGPVSGNDEQMWVLEGEEFVYKKIKYVPGLYKIFDEILVNASDNYQRDKKMTMIKVDFGKQAITILNDGKSIPIQIHKTHKIYVPELIFGHLLTSSNYNDEQKKTTGGRNGYGAKLTNIFSSKFSVEIADSISKKILKIEWADNMTKTFETSIEDYEGNSYTKVTFQPDYKRFNMARMTPDMLSILKRRVYDISGITKVNVYLNNKLVQIPNFKSYVKKYLYYQQDLIVSIENQRSPRWQVLLCHSEGQFMQVSFVNGIYTSRGGTHINYLVDQIVQKILLALAKKKINFIKPFQIKSKLRLFVNCLIENPSFDSQTKQTLTTQASQFGSTCLITEDIIKEILKSGLIQKIIQEHRLKEHNKIDKQLKRLKRNRLIIPKLDDANEAGRSDDCCLILTQGDSAKALALCGIQSLGRDYYGVYPLKGKIVNVNDMTPKQVMENTQLSNIVKILGLSFEKQYRNTKDLRYSSVMIMADQDSDGSHIKGLVINFFQTFWPSLCKINGFLKQFITPIIKCRKGNQSISFYSEVDYRKWLESNEVGWSIKYYKGLGTSTAQEAKQYFGNLQHHELSFSYQDQADKAAMNLAFGKKNADQRKNWLINYNPEIGLDYRIKKVKIEDFIHKQMIHFSISDNVRSIPSLVDGLKPSQRKVLFACFKRNLVNQIKVAQLAGYVSEHSAYHHGQASLCSTIIGMAQNYIGSNNLNLLQPIGQFGTRYQNGKDAASPRYIFTKLSKLARYLFHQADDHVVDYIIQQNQMIQPIYYVPILPLVLINGCQGIGTGWSTIVLPHKVQDVIQMTRSRIMGKSCQTKIGWQNFKGTIQKDKKGYVVKGIVEQSEDKWIIRQIPLNKSIRQYKEYLQEKLSSVDNPNPDLDDLKQYHRDNNIQFVVKFIDGKQPQHHELQKYFKISTLFQQSNMHLFTSLGKIQKFDNIQAILEEFYQVRIDSYKKRIRYLLSKYEKQANIAINQIRFIKAMIQGKLRMVQNKQEWIKRLQQMNFSTFQSLNVIASTKHKQEDDQGRNKDFNYLLNMPIWTFCFQKIDELQRGKREVDKLITYYQNITPQELWLEDIQSLQTVWREINYQSSHIGKRQYNERQSQLPLCKNQQQDAQRRKQLENKRFTRGRKNQKKNMMQLEIEQQAIQQNGRKRLKTDQLIRRQIQIKNEIADEKANQPQKKTSDINEILSKYLAKQDKDDENSLQNRVKARLLQGGQDFKSSYDKAKQKLYRIDQQSENLSE